MHSDHLVKVRHPWKKWFLPLAGTFVALAFFLVTFFNVGQISNLTSTSPSNPPMTNSSAAIIASSNADRTRALKPNSSAGSNLARLAYLVAGSKGDLDQLWRTLLAVYHPRNIYVVHLDLEAPETERMELVSRVKNEMVFARVCNVHVIEKSDMVTYPGPTMIANTLHACAILLKKSKDWDWFINLSATDYPLVTQDDLLYTFSTLPKNLNFIEHTSQLGWKAKQRAKPLIIDPGLYKSTKSDVFWVEPKRELPTAFKLFTGSAWFVLSREFIEYCIWGWDNLPRTLLMYYTNFVSATEGYFQTVICNAPQFIPTIVNHDLHYVAWDMPPKQHPVSLTVNHTARMVAAKVPFARKFAPDDLVLDKIDEELLGKRKRFAPVPGGWCAGRTMCSDVGDATLLKPGPGAATLAVLMDKIVRSDSSGRKQCK